MCNNQTADDCEFNYIKCYIPYVRNQKISVVGERETERLAIDIPNS